MKTFPRSLVISALLRILVSSLGVMAFLLPRSAPAQETWTFDPSFQRTQLLLSSENANGVKVLRSGKVLSYTINGGLLSGANEKRIGALLRLDPNTGAIDPTWNPDPTVTGYGFLGVAEAPDGKIYYSTALAGEVPDSNDSAMFRLIRLNTDGSRDTTFNSPIFGLVSRFITVQPDGKIIVCTGGIAQVGNLPANSIVQTVRLNADGSLDTSFQSPNFQFNANDPPGNAASGDLDLGVFGNPVVDPDTGKIYFCGTFRFVNGQPRKAIVRCNTDGTLDTTFVPTGLTAGNLTLIGRAIVLQAGGKVVLGGTRLRTTAGGNTSYALLRFNNDGTLDSSFTLFPTTNSSGTPLVAGYTGPRDIHVLPGGKILTSDIRVIRFLPDGGIDPGFAPLDYTSPYFTNAGQVAGFRFDVDPTTGAVYIENPGPLYAGLGGAAVPGEITKVNSDASIDTQFHAPIAQSEDFAPSLRIDTNGKVYVLGSHTDFGSSTNSTITRLLPDGTRDPSYSLDTLPFADKQAAGFALLLDNSAYVTYSSGSFNGGYSFSNLVHLLPSGAIDTTFRPSNALQTSFAINAFDGNDVAKSSLADISAAPLGKVYLFPEGAQATVNGNGNLKPTRVNADGTEDTSVPPLGFPVGEVTRDANGITGGSTGYVHRLTQTPDGGFIILVSVAPFPTTTGDPYNFKLMKFKADGSQDASYASADVTSDAPAILDFPVLFDPVTGFTTQPFNGFYSTGGQFPVSSAASFPDGSVLIAGKFLLPGDTHHRSLAKLTPTGALDNSFTPPTGSDHLTSNPDRSSRLLNARVAPDGKIWVLGRFDSVDNHPVPGVVRLNSDGTFDDTFQLADVSYYDSYGDFADVAFADNNTAYLLGTFRRNGESAPFAVTRIVHTSAPVITNPLSATVPGNQQFIFQVLATDATSLSVTNLPPGLTYNSALQTIVGIPTAFGTFQVIISATNADGTTNATLTLTIQLPPPSGPIITSSTSVTGRTGSRFIFQVFADNVSSAARLNVIGLPPGLTFDPLTGVISGTVTTDGTFGATVIVTEGNDAATSILELTFSSDPTLPVITSPSMATLTPGGAFFYQITAPATSDPNDPTVFSLIGTLPNGLTFDAANGTISGTYSQAFPRQVPGPHLSGGVITNVQLFATNSHGTTTLPLIFLLAPTGVGNISTRLSIGTDANVLIAGFIITGTAPKKLIIRAAGPSLAQFGITNALTDPVLELHDASQTLGTNDDWRSFQEQEIIDSTLAPRDSREPAVIAYLNPGAYTAIVKGKNNTTGIGTVEVYDLGTASLASMPSLSQAKLANISTRGFVQTNDNVMIGGFIIQSGTTRVIVRAIGPELTNYGVPGALQDTTLELHDSNGTIASNDNWRDTQEQEIIATTIPPTDDREAAIVASLAPGGYTAIVRGKNGSTGVATVEMYLLP